jgi:choline/glycine/proline betaine transport protein
MCWGMVRAMRLEVVKRVSTREARLAPLTSGGGDWKARLRTLTHNPLKKEVLAFLQSQVKPALEDVAAELRKQNLEVTVEDGDDGRVWLQVGHGEEMDFFYSVRPIPYEPPSFMFEDPRRRRKEDDTYFRAEVHLREGGQDYDVMGWRKDELIHDVLDQYQRHIHFLNVVR